MPKAVANEIEIEYETVGDRAAPAFLLFMGAGEQLILWPRALKDLLTRAGYQVVSFDYRDAGLSTKFDHAGRGRPWSPRAEPSDGRRSLCALPTGGHGGGCDRRA